MNADRQKLQNPLLYPRYLRDHIEAMSGYATELANRWAHGWPERVTALISSGEYLEALTRQEFMERDALWQSAGSHLNSVDVLQARGLGLAPPAALPDRELSDMPGTAGSLTVLLSSLDEHGKPEELTFTGMSEAFFTAVLPHAKDPKPEALFRGNYRYDTQSEKWVPTDM